MCTMIAGWDYLLVTASSGGQAEAYRRQLDVRQELGLLQGVRQVLVVPDPGARRIGSGGSTIHCLMEVLARELAGRQGALRDHQRWAEALRKLRVLILHAGGDSKRLPAYGPCGKLFVPVPGDSDSAVGTTLFDRQAPRYLALPPATPGRGQVVICSGDVLLLFDPAAVRFDAPGITGLGCKSMPEQAGRHGVYCPAGHSVRRFLQKPTLDEQAATGAIDRYGQSVLDLGVMQFDAQTAIALLEVFGAAPDEAGRLAWTGEMGQAIDELGLDFYGEIACALGTEVTSSQHTAAAKRAGSRWPDTLLGRLFQALRPVDFHVQVLPQCGFLHLGTTRQLISSGLELLRQDRGVAQLRTYLSMNNDLSTDGAIAGTNAWVEGCRIDAKLTLGGENLVVGAAVEQPLDLPPGACLDVIPGRTRDGRDTWFIRYYGIHDLFKDALDAGATLCGRAVGEWLSASGLGPQDVWDAAVPPEARTVWDARVFPAEPDPAAFRRWRWLLAPEEADEAQKQAYRDHDRYSLAEIATLADHEAFHAWRARMRAAEIRRSLRHMFRLDSGFSAADLAHTLGSVAPADRAPCAAELLAEARWHHAGNRQAVGDAPFAFSRIIHTLGSAVAKLAGDADAALDALLPGLAEALDPAVANWLADVGLGTDGLSAGKWAAAAQTQAFSVARRAILSSGRRDAAPPRSVLRGDEIVWGRAPARLDLGGGWSDTPPYSLENGGSVLNAAVDLNGQPPIHCYARVIDEPVVRIASIDLGTRVEIATLDELLDFASATSEFALAKAALALSGFSSTAAGWPADTPLDGMLRQFGGGIELTTLAAIPKGSGLGTSSIVGAVILAVVQRIMGRTLTRPELFHGVLRLEQALSTGGGWQDQVGGAVEGVKVISAAPGIVPDVGIHFVPPDLLDPRTNGGQTLLYYTGITRLAKNILQQVVGRYLDRDRTALATLRQIHAMPPRVADAMARKDLAAFGRLVDVAWRQNRTLDPDSSTPEIEALLDRARPHLYGAKLLGAGGGGFLVMVCRSPADAAAIRRDLEADPPNDRARFFDFSVSTDGLVVTVC